MRYDPFADAVNRGVQVGVTDLPGTDGWWIQDEGTVLLDAQLDARQRRVMCAHMLAHITLRNLADRCDCPQHDTEVRVARLTASRLIGLPQLIWAMKRADDADAVAERLGVTTAVLAKRLRTLTELELQQVRARTGRRLVWSTDPYSSPLRCSVSATLGASTLRAS